MALSGEAYKKTFTVIKQGIPENPTLSYLDSISRRCCFKLPVVADEASSDDYKNDSTSFFFGYSDIVNDADLHLFNGDDEDLGSLFGSGYGTEYAYGFHEDGGKTYIGYLINWKNVLDDIGEGKYYVKCIADLITGGTYEETSFTYCLYQFAAYRVEWTVRIDFYHNGLIGNRDIDTDFVSYKDLNWFNSIRIPNAIILDETSEYEIEEVQYTNGQYEDARNEQTVLYRIEVASVPNWLHRYLKIDVLQSDNMYVTDYSTNNPLKPFVNKNLKMRGNYTPNWIEMAQQSSVNVQLTPKFNNLRKKFS